MNTIFEKHLEEKAALFGSNVTDFDKVDAAIDTIIEETHLSPDWWMCFHHVNGEIFLSSRDRSFKKVKASDAKSTAMMIFYLCGVKVQTTKRNDQFVLVY